MVDWYCGTVNDISALGAEPYALACGLILEEGLLPILRELR
jgi:hydrogenase maturation factor